MKDVFFITTVLRDSIRLMSGAFRELFKFIYLVLCVLAFCLHICTYITRVPDPHRGQKSVVGSLGTGITEHISVGN